MRSILAMVGIFIGVMVLLYFGINMVAEVPEPAVNTSAYQQYTNLTGIINLSYGGFQGILLILFAGILLAAILLMIPRRR
ncbi:MAG: hypothetical protein DRP18_00370 [Candidatus Aenigmatarchaeota archaeon]|nr:MAG: hypothetical protein DRP18_00370 [Candidatus Aenigmarchaeota archaeon]